MILVCARHVHCVLSYFAVTIDSETFDLRMETLTARIMCNHVVLMAVHMGRLPDFLS